MGVLRMNAMASVGVRSLARLFGKRSVDYPYTVENAHQHPVNVTSQEVTDTLNVLVNDGSAVGAYTLDLIVPPKLTSDIL